MFQPPTHKELMCLQTDIIVMTVTIHQMFCNKAYIAQISAIK